MIKVLGFMAIGILCGFLLRHKDWLVNFITPLFTCSVYLLLFLIGVNIGINKMLVDRLGVIGVQAFVLTLGSVLGSSIMALLCYRLFFNKKNKRQNK